MNTPGKTLALEEGGTLGGTLSEGYSQALVNALADTILRECLCKSGPVDFA